jgi:hypothetical protein
MSGFQLIFLRCSRSIVILIWSTCLVAVSHAWLPDSSSKLVNNFKSVSSISFTGNATFPDYFIVLNQDENSIAIGGRNRIYNLSIYDFHEKKEGRIDWPSSDAHGQLCILKGKTEDDCQNYIRILYYTEPGRLVVCGTNSYKPLCRTYTFKVFITASRFVRINLGKIAGWEVLRRKRGGRDRSVSLQPGAQQHVSPIQRSVIFCDCCGFFRGRPFDIQGAPTNGTL